MTVRLAFLGCGNVTDKHASTVKKAGVALQCSFASRDGQKANEFCRRHSGIRAFDSYEQAINSADVDAVLIATPPHMHLQLTLDALAAGKHVIVEKPPYLKSSDFDTVIAAAENAGRQILVAENYFYKPAAFLLRRLIKEKVIGQPLVVQLNALKTQQIDDDWRADPAVTGGGALFEGGIHWVNLMNNLGMETTESCGMMRQNDSALERTSVVTFRYKEGAVGTLAYSWEVPSLLQGLRLSRVYGSEGSIIFESNGIFLATIGKRKRLYFPGLADINGYRAMFRDFVESISQDRSPQFTAEMARKDQQVIESVYNAQIKR